MSENSELKLSLSPDPRRKRQVRSGRKNEEFVESLNKLCENEQVAKLWKTTPGMRVVGANKGVVKAVFTSKGPPDYAGYVISGIYCGKSVLVETKRVSCDRLRFSVVQRNQAHDLTEHSASGGLSVLLVVKWPERIVYSILWQKISHVYYQSEIPENPQSLVLDSEWIVKPGIPYLKRFL